MGFPGFEGDCLRSTEALPWYCSSKRSPERNVTGLDVNMFTYFLLLYADDTVIFANSAEALEKKKPIDLL